MKKTVIVSFCLILCVVTGILGGCAKKNTEPTVSMYDLRVKMSDADKDLPEMMNVSDQDTDAEHLFSYLSDLPYEKVDAYYLSYASDGMASELAVIALKDEKDVPDCKKSLQDHVQKRINLYRSYAADQVAKAEKAKIIDDGRYVALIMCDDQNAVEKAFRDFIKGA